MSWFCSTVYLLLGFVSGAESQDLPEALVCKLRLGIAGLENAGHGPILP